MRRRASATHPPFSCTPPPNCLPPSPSGAPNWKHDPSEAVHRRLWKSVKLWGLYADLEESLGTVTSTMHAYDRAVDLKVATPDPAPSPPPPGVPPCPAPSPPPMRVPFPLRIVSIGEGPGPFLRPWSHPTPQEGMDSSPASSFSQARTPRSSVPKKIQPFR